MNVQELRKVHRRRPFRPFKIHLADGWELLVAHPECFALSAGTRTAAVVPPRSPIEIIDLPLVTGVAFVGPAPRRRG
jgi:hypothetical protein